MLPKVQLNSPRISQLQKHFRVHGAAAEQKRVVPSLGSSEKCLRPSKAPSRSKPLAVEWNTNEQRGIRKIASKLYLVHSFSINAQIPTVNTTPMD
jgi:hypothetical protein